MKRSKRSIVNISEYINIGKSLKIERIGSRFKNKRIAYCVELPLGIISSSRYINIKTLNIISAH